MQDFFNRGKDKKYFHENQVSQWNIYILFRDTKCNIYCILGRYNLEAKIGYIIRSTFLENQVCFSPWMSIAGGQTIVKLFRLVRNVPEFYWLHFGWWNPAGSDWYLADHSKAKKKLFNLETYKYFLIDDSTFYSRLLIILKYSHYWLMILYNTRTLNVN